MTALPAPPPPAVDADRPASVADGPRLRVVQARSRARLLWVVASLLLLAAAVFASVTLNALAADDAVVADELERQIRVAEVDHGRLMTEVARLESPARIAAAAADLGLVRVDHPRMLRVERHLPADGVVNTDELVRRGEDVLKPLLAQD